MNTVHGDLIKMALAGKFDVIVHGCNCFCTMGAGIAKSIKSEFPEAFRVDLTTEKGARLKLGTFSYADVIRSGFSITIVNAYTQFEWSGSGNKADYAAIGRVFAIIKKDFAGRRIGYPLIGAGLAGGDWNIISEIINCELEGEDHTLVRYSS